MKKLLLFASVVCGVLALLPLGASSSTSSAASLPSVPAACVVVTGPSGVTLQAGYAPNGPTDCTPL